MVAALNCFQYRGPEVAREAQPAPAAWALALTQAQRGLQLVLEAVLAPPGLPRLSTKWHPEKVVVAAVAETTRRRETGAEGAVEGAVAARYSVVLGQEAPEALRV